MGRGMSVTGTLCCWLERKLRICGITCPIGAECVVGMHHAIRCQWAGRESGRLCAERMIVPGVPSDNCCCAGASCFSNHTRGSHQLR
ncbi:hypothetical protein VUR80DRAFT_4765 [Thermomyces stellatus]